MLKPSICPWNMLKSVLIAKANIKATDEPVDWCSLPEASERERGPGIEQGVE